MAPLTKRKNASPQKTQNGGSATTQGTSRKKLQKQKKLHGLAVQEKTHSKIRNKLFLAVIIYILAGAGFLYWRGVSTPNELPPEIESEILESYPRDAKNVELPKNLRRSSPNAGSATEPKKDEKVKASPAVEQSNNATKTDGATGEDSFKVHIQKSLNPKPISDEQQWTEVKYTKNHNVSHVRVFTMDNFLSPRECDGLMKAHMIHVKQHSEQRPIVCFSGEHTMKKYLHRFGVSWAGKVTEKDFTEGTLCLNESLSSQLDGKLPWSMSTSFYPGESPFSSRYTEHVEKYAGLDRRNGGKFQVTSYPTNVGYKLHTDCTVGNADARDRYATILVYLNDVAEGGETEFTELGVKITPKKGRALLWNNMDGRGNCDATSHHKAARVKKGKKFILQRWYYYENFPALGKRTPPPELPRRSHDLTPRVACDLFDSGSCRWYDEWNFDHLVDYRRAMRL